MRVVVFAVTLAAISCTWSGLPTFAQGLKAVRPIAGYVCMSVNLGKRAPVEESDLPPIFAEPSDSASPVARAVSVVFVKWPERNVSGFTEILRLNGTEGWIATHLLEPWHPLGDPRAKCTPSLMSNGKPGFDIH